jgi:pimeloyl-CoA dehydrogenase
VKVNFELNEQQSALAESLSRLLANRYPFERRRALVAAGQLHDTQTWAKLGEMGVLALTLPQAHGGFDCGARDLLPVMQSLGRALALEPVLATGVLGATAVRLAGSENEQASVLPRVATGETILAWAHDEPAARHDSVRIETRAEQKNGQWMLSGLKSPVLAAAIAGRLVVSARVAGSGSESEGLALFLVDPKQDGVSLRNFILVDDSSASEVKLLGVVAEPLGDPFDGRRALSALKATLAAGIAGACADMAGGAQAAFELAMDYLRVRKQFGRAIGENQALRHRAADMLVCLEMARSMAMAAASAVDQPDGEEAALDLHRAKLSVARNAREVMHGAIQIHGGMGVTEECAVGHYLRRLQVLDQLFGDADAHAAHLAAAL